MNEWISCETEFPSADEIICLNKNTNEIFNMKLVESKGGGNKYWDENCRLRDFTHWKPMLEPHKQTD